MIETSNPEIDVAELMQRVRAEAAALKLKREQQAAAGARPRAVVPARLPMPIAVPDVALPKGVDTKKEKLEQLLLRARHKWEGRRGFQKFWRRLFPRQRPFNRIMLDVLAALTKNDRSLANRIQQLTDCVQAQQQVIRALAKRGDVDAMWMRANGAAPAGGVGEEELQKAQQHLRDLQAQADRLGAHLRNFENEARPAVHHVHALQGQTDRVGEHVLNVQRDLASAIEYLRGVQTQADGLGVQLNQLQLDVGKSSSETAFVRRAVDELATRRGKIEQQLSRLEDKHGSDANFIKATVAEHSAVIARLLGDGAGESQSRPHESGGGDSQPASSLDAFYAALRERIHGSRAEVKQRAEFYLQFIAEAGAGSADRPVIDLACRRGEWLELLQDRKFVGRGADTNSSMSAACQELGLAVQHADAVSYLEAIRSESVGAVTGFHVMERLSPEELMAVLRESRRVLQPGGVAIFTSPNCKNLTVGACSMYAEPTHRQPVVPETAAFMMESVGFENVRVTYLAPATDSPFNGDTPESAALKELLAGPQEFAVIARVPRGA